MKFKTTLQLGGRTATGIVIPKEVVESLNAGKKPPVKVTINGYTYRSTVATMGGEFKVTVSFETRSKTGLKAGDEIEVNIELDTDVREVDVPEYLQTELDINPKAKEVFNTLSISKKRWIIIPMEQAKSEETRKKRISRIIAMLNTGEFTYKI